MGNVWKFVCDHNTNIVKIYVTAKLNGYLFAKYFGVYKLSKMKYYLLIENFHVMFIFFTTAVFFLVISKDRKDYFDYHGK